MENKFFVQRIRRVSGVFDKGVEIKDTFDEAKQAFHAQMANWAYGANKDCTFCSSLIMDGAGTILHPYCETWNAPDPSPAVATD